MAQFIRKLQSGGEVSPRLFEWAGQQYNVNDLKNNLIREREGWLNNQKFSNRERELFNQGFNDLITAIDSNGFSRNPDGSWSNTAGISSTGQRDTNLIGRTKNNSNNAVGLASGLLDYVMNLTPTYAQPKAPQEQKKERFNINLRDAVSRKYLGGNWDPYTYERYDPLNEETNTRGYQNRMGHVSSILDDYISQLNDPGFDTRYDLPDNYTNKSELLGYLQEARNKLADGVLDDSDYTSLARAGITGLDEILGTYIPQDQPVQNPMQNRIGTLDRSYQSPIPGIERRVDKDGNAYFYREGESNPLQNGILFNNRYDPETGQYYGAAIVNGQLLTRDQLDSLPEGLRNDYSQILNELDQSYSLGTEDLSLSQLGDYDGQQYDRWRDASSFFDSIGDNRALIELLNTNGSYHALVDTTTGDVLERGMPTRNAIDGVFRIGNTPIGNTRPGQYLNVGYTSLDPNDPLTFSPENIAGVKNRLYSAIKNNSLEANKAKVDQFIQASLTRNPSQFSKGRNNLYRWDIGNESGNYITFTPNNDGSFSYAADARAQANNSSASPTGVASSNIVPTKREGVFRDTSITGLKGGFKEGGILKAQQGGRVTPWTFNVGADTTDQDVIAQRRRVSESFDSPNKGTISEIFGNNSEFENAGGNISWQDKTRLGAAITDLLGVGLGFVPGANLASAGTGFASSIATAAADFSDEKTSLGSDVWNLVSNLGMDAISLIPVGKTFKGLRALKTFQKSIPLVLTALNASQVITDKDGIRATLNKIQEGDLGQLNRDDFRNLAVVGSSVLGIRNLTKYTNNRNIFGENPSNKRSIEYSVNGEAQARPATLDRNKLKNMSKQQREAYARETAASEYNTRTGQNVTAEDINVSKLPYLGIRTSKIPGSPTTDRTWRRGFQRYEEPSQLKNLGQGYGNWFGRGSMGTSFLSDASLAQRIPFLRNRIYRRPTSTQTNTNQQTFEFLREGGRIVKHQLGGPFNRRSSINPYAYGLPVYDNLNTNTVQPNDNSVVSPTVVNDSVMNRNIGNNQNPYLGVENTRANAINPDTWNSYYDFNKILMDRPVSFRNQTSQQAINALNNLTSQSSGWIPNVNATGYQGWNNLFDQYFGDYNTNVFGKDPKKFDLLGPTTWNRRNLVNTINTLYNSPESSIPTANGRIYNNNGTWEVLPDVSAVTGNPGILQPLDNKLDLNLAGNNTNKTNNASIRSIQPRQNRLNNLQFLPEDAIALGRMVGTVQANNRATRQVRNALRPTLMDTYENYVPVTGDYLGRSAAYNQATRLENEGRRLAESTSDGNLGFAANLEASSRAGQARLQGDLINAQRFYQTGEQSRAESNAAKARRTEAANYNRSAINNINLAKAELSAQNRVNNWMNAVQPWAAGIESRIRQNRATQNQLGLEEAGLNLQNKYGPQYSTIVKNSENARIKAGVSPEEWDASIEGQLYQRQVKDLESQYQKDAIAARRNLLANNSWLFRNLYAKGGKVSAADKAKLQQQKDFNKSLKDSQNLFMKELQSVRREHGQMMRGLSSFTADLIKAGMRWK